MKNEETNIKKTFDGKIHSFAECSSNLSWRVPETMSLRDAATIPAVYATVYYAFFFYNPISKGKSILIHAGSGGIGLAAIRIALAYGMEVYTTCSTEQKKQFILEQFPQLKGKFTLLADAVLAHEMNLKTKLSEFYRREYWKFP